MKFNGLFKLESIAFHGAGESRETTSLFRSNMKTLPNGEEIRVHNFSSATVRSAFRRACFYDLLRRLDLDISELPTMNHIVMFSGGPRLESSEVTVRLNFLRELFKWLPGMQLFGGTTKFNMIQSVLQVYSLDALLPRYVENFIIPGAVVEAFGIDKGSLAENVKEIQFNTKRDIRELPDEILKKKVGELTEAEKAEFLQCFDDEETYFQVIENPDRKNTTLANMFSIEVLKAGTLLGHWLIIENTGDKQQDEMLKSCLAALLKYFKEEMPYFGGKKSNGMGLVTFDYKPDLTDCSLYAEFVEQNKERIRTIVLDPELFNKYDVVLKYQEQN